ncbi:MAG: ATPase, T2SS/T4P/T4SS family [Phycisphaerae bacterium]
MPVSVVAYMPYGGYVSLLKLLPFLVLLLVWVRLLTWVDKDTERAHLPRELVNAGLFAGLVTGCVLFFVLPGFLLGFVGFLGLMLVDLGVYLGLRNAKVGLKDLGDELQGFFRGLVTRKAKDEEAAAAARGNVFFQGKNKQSLQPPPDDAPERPAFDALQSAFEMPLRREAERVDLVPAPEGTAVMYRVDGVDFPHTRLKREDAAGAIAMVKVLAGMDPGDRRRPQKGTLTAGLSGKKHTVEVHSAGSTAGERVRCELDIAKRYTLKADQLGLTRRQAEMLDRVLHDGSAGVVLAAAPKGHGLTSLLYALTRKHDAFVEHIQTVEIDPPIELEGVTQNQLKPGAGPAEVAKQLSWINDQQPDVLMCGKLEERTVAQELARIGQNNIRVYAGMRTASALESLQGWRKMVGERKPALKSARLLIAGRVGRKLCSACKVAYQPDENTLRRLGFDPAKTEKLFQARTEPMRDAKGNEVICTFCGGLGYKGRFGAYELFEITDEVRDALMASENFAEFKSLFRKQKQVYIQEAALEHVRQGETSVQEVLRMMKGASNSAGSAGEPQPAGAA